MSDDLKPCPFCGGEKNTICCTDYDGREAYAVSCRYPECHGTIFTLGYGYFADKAEAIAAWNTRADADRIEQLERERDQARKYRDAYAEFGRIGTQAVRDLEAKLAKAVEALRSVDNEYTDIQWGPELQSIKQVRTVLAELEGGE
jgi:Lar family restriction alleviation protein